MGHTGLRRMWRDAGMRKVLWLNLLGWYKLACPKSANEGFFDRLISQHLHLFIVAFSLMSLNLNRKALTSLSIRRLNKLVRLTRGSIISPWSCHPYTEKYIEILTYFFVNITCYGCSRNGRYKLFPSEWCWMAPLSTNVDYCAEAFSHLRQVVLCCMCVYCTDDHPTKRLSHKATICCCCCCCCWLTYLETID